MSYRIEYQWAAFREPAVRGDRFVIAILLIALWPDLVLEERAVPCVLQCDHVAGLRAVDERTELSTQVLLRRVRVGDQIDLRESETLERSNPVACVVDASAETCAPRIRVDPDAQRAR